MPLYLLASLEVSGPQKVILYLIVLFEYIKPIIVGLALLFLIYKTFRAIFQKPSSPYKTKVRRTLAIVWALLILVIAGWLISRAIEDKRSNSYNTELAIAYAKTYNNPVILPADSEYTIDFDQKWGHIEISLAANGKNHLITQVPISEVGAKYFNAENGYCDFSSMRENNDAIILRDEACSQASQIKEFKIYKSSRENYYVVYKNVAAAIDIGTNYYPSTKPNLEEVETLVRKLRVTDKNELVKVIESEHYNANYDEVLDRWHKEGRF